MRKYRRLTAFLLIAVMLFTAAVPAAAQSTIAAQLDNFAAAQYQPNYQMTEVSPLPFTIDDFFNQPSEKWAALTSGIAPATLDCTYTLQDDVVEINSKTSIAARNAITNISTVGMRINGITNQSLKTAPKRILDQGGFIDKSVLENAIGQNIEIGKTVVDVETGTAFKISAPFGNAEEQQVTVKLADTYNVVTPELNEILKSISVGNPGESIALTYGNFTVPDQITDCLTAEAKSNIQLMASGSSNFKHITGSEHQFPFPLEFDSSVLTAANGKVKVRLSGGLSFGDFKLVGHYSAPFGSYEAALQFKQEFYLNVDLMAVLHEEVPILLAGIEVPFVIGSIKAGIYLILGIDGEFRLEIKVREWTTPKMGVKGSTFLFIPATIAPVFSFGEGKNKGAEGDVNLNGRLNAYAKFGPRVDIEIFGFNVVGAGALVGAGVEVKAFSDAGSKLLDIHLYGIVDIYAKAFGKEFQIVGWNPSLMRKTQANTEGYLVDIVECYFLPGRIGGQIVKDPPISDAFSDFVPAANVPYRIRAEGPKGKRYFPDKIDNIPMTEETDPSKWPVTNAYGEFYIGNGFPGVSPVDGIALGEGDKVYVEFYKSGNILASDPAMPEFPFTSITMSDVEWFNSYAVGQVAPKRVRDWSKGPEDTELIYLSDRIVDVYQESYYGSGSPSSAPAKVKTDAMGCFDTRDWFVDTDANGVKIYNFIATGTMDNQTASTFEVVANPHFVVNANYSSIAVVFDHDLLEETVTLREICIPRMAPLIISREIIPVEGSYKKEERADCTIIDSMQYDEYVFIVNPSGKRTVTAAEIDFMSDFMSFADMTYGDYDMLSDDIEKELNSLAGNPRFRPDVTMTNPSNLRVVTSVHNGKGHTVFSQKVTLEWVWQIHPDPVVITSEDHVEMTASGGVFQVTADGLFPAFSISGEPYVFNTNTGAGMFASASSPQISRVRINRDTGLMTVPAGLSAGEYKFKISAVQDIRMIEGYPYDFGYYNGFGHENLNITNETLQYFYGHDPMPPDEQEFTLTITDGSAAVPPETTEVPDETVEAPGETVEAPPEIVGPPPEIVGPPPEIKKAPPETMAAPVITVKDGPYMVQQGSALQVPYTLTGGAPDTVEAKAAGMQGVSVTGFTVNKTAQTVNAPNNLAAGSYTVTVTAANITGSSSAMFILTVEAAGVAPVIQPGNHNFSFQAAVGAQAVNTTITATGTAPITWSLQAYKDPVPWFVSINEKTGALTIGTDASAGTYYFNIQAQNNFGADTKMCTVTVKENRTAPKINRSFYSNTMTQGTDYTAQFTATGSTPLYWSLAPVNDRMPVPAEAGIDSTGMLSIKGSIAAGSYEFIVLVSNDVGADSLTFSITVRSLIPQNIPTQPVIPSDALKLSFMSNNSNNSNIEIVPLSAVQPSSPGILQQYDVNIAYLKPDISLADRAKNHLQYVKSELYWGNIYAVPAAGNELPEPLNEITVHWNHARDVYTYDRETVNGTDLIHWEDTIRVCGGSDWSPGLTNRGITVRIGSYESINEKYHTGYMYFNNAALEKIHELVQKVIDRKMNELFAPVYNNWSTQDARIEAGMRIGIGIGADGVVDRFNFSRLDYGTTLNAMAAQSGGLHTVTLDKTTGATVTGKYFAVGLKGNPMASLAFVQDSATVTFAGKDIDGDVSMNMLYNFGFYQNPDIADQMLALAGTGGGEHFAYSFTHHGALPGMATFAITTGISEGSKVSVYKFDPNTEDFSLIANGITVGAGGVVTYRNNTMSDYLITTEKISWASASDVALTENGTFMDRVTYSGSWLYFVIIFAALLIIGTIALIIVLRNKKRRPQHENS